MFLFALFSWLELAAKYPWNLQIFNFFFFFFFFFTPYRKFGGQQWNLITATNVEN